MPDSIVCTRSIKGGSFSCDQRPKRLRTLHKLSKVKRDGVAPRAGRLGLTENAHAKTLSVDYVARVFKTHPVVDPISHGWSFDDPVFLKDLTFTFAGEIDQIVIPTQVTRNPQPRGEIIVNFIFSQSALSRISTKRIGSIGRTSLPQDKNQAGNTSKGKASAAVKAQGPPSFTNKFPN